MVVADCGRGDQSDRRAAEQPFVAVRARPHDQSVGPGRVAVRNLAAFEILHAGVGFQHAFEKGNVAVGQHVRFCVHLPAYCFRGKCNNNFGIAVRIFAKACFYGLFRLRQRRNPASGGRIVKKPPPQLLRRGLPNLMYDYEKNYPISVSQR